MSKRELVWKFWCGNLGRPSQWWMFASTNVQGLTNIHQHRRESLFHTYMYKKILSKHWSLKYFCSLLYAAVKRWSTNKIYVKLSFHRTNNMYTAYNNMYILQPPQCLSATARRLRSCRLAPIILYICLSVCSPVCLSTRMETYAAARLCVAQKGAGAAAAAAAAAAPLMSVTTIPKRPTSSDSAGMKKSYWRQTTSIPNCISIVLPQHVKVRSAYYGWLLLSKIVFFLLCRWTPLVHWKKILLVFARVPAAKPF